MSDYVPVVDESKWQGRIDHRVMARNGVAAVAIRLGNGRVNDANAPAYIADARAAGLLVGGYWFMNPKVDRSGAAQAARAFARAHQLGALDFPLQLDVETFANEPNGEGSDLRGAALSAWYDDAVVEYTKLAGRRPLYYTNQAFYDGHGMARASEDQAACPLWCARYPFYSPTACAAHVPPLDANRWADWIMAETPSRPRMPAGWDTWVAWQFSAGFNARGAAYGVSSDSLDLNIFKADAWRELTGRVLPAGPKPDHIVVDATSIIVPAGPRPAGGGNDTATVQEDIMLIRNRDNGEVGVSTGGYIVGTDDIAWNSAPTSMKLEVGSAAWDELVAVSTAKKAADVTPPLVVPAGAAGALTFPPFAINLSGVATPGAG